MVIKSQMVAYIYISDTRVQEFSQARKIDITCGKY